MASRPSRPASLALALALCAAVPGLAAPAAIGAPVPDLTLPTLDGAQRTLSERDGPTVLVFFRGVW